MTPFAVKYPACTERRCRGPREWHGSCVTCGSPTCSQTQAIDPVTLRRRQLHLCHCCELPAEYVGARKRRTEKDWQEMTEPLDAALSFSLREQFPAKTRRILRAFLAANSPFAEVSDVSAIALNASIRSLGIDDRVYAEVRGGVTTLRRFA